MKLIRTLFIILCLGPAIAGYGQSCEDQVVQYLLHQTEPCGHHGSLQIELLGNTSQEKASDFVYNWKNLFFSDYKDEVDFVLFSERSGSSISVYKYAMSYNQITIEDASLTLVFNKDNELITYNCNNASVLPRGLVGRAINSPINTSGLAKKLVKEYRLGKLVSSENIIRIVDEEPVLISMSQWITVDGEKEIAVELDPQKKRLVAEPISKHIKTTQSTQVLRTTGGSGGGGSSGTIVVSDDNIDCGTQTIGVANSNYQMPTSQQVGCTTGSVIKHEFRKTPSVGDFSLVPQQCFENTTCDFTDNCDSGSIKYQMANVIYHVTEFYMAELSSVFGDFPDMDFEIGGTSAPYDVSSPIVAFGTNGLQEPAAEDISYIKAAALDRFLQENYSLQPNGQDGIRFGYLDYVLYRDLQYENLFTHSNPSASRGLVNSDVYVSGMNEQDGAQVWSGTLYRVDDVTNNNDAFELLTDLLAMTVPGNSQQQEVENLITLAENRTDIITPEELCAIKNIVADRYAVLGFSSIQDFFIKDNLGDVGNEPNNENVGGNFYSSPHIWNCESGSCTTHVKPSYTGPGSTNYIQVRLTKRGCTDFADATGSVKVLICVAQASLDYYAGAFNPPFGLDGVVATIPISDGVVQADGSAIYSFPWPVFNPEDPQFVDLVQDNGRLHVCVRALVLSDDDPMYVENWNNKSSNNNIAQDNMSVIDDYPGVMPPSGGAVFLVNPKFDPVYVGNGNGTGTGTGTGTGGPTPVKKVPTRIQLNILGPGNPAQLVNENDITVTLDDRAFRAWQEGGEKGRGFKYERFRRGRTSGRTGGFWHVFHVTDPGFGLGTLMLDENSINPIRVNVKRSESFKPFQFDIELVDETEECIYGGERYDVREAVAQIGRRESVNSSIANISIAPNPVLDKLVVEFSQPIQLMEVVALDGTVMYGTTEQVGQIITVDVSEYTNGAYFVKATFEDGQIKTKKFLKI